MSPYAEVTAQASPAQRAALEALSQRLGVTGEQRALAVTERLDFADPLARNFQLEAENSANEKINALRLATLDSLFKTHPDLRWSDSEGHEAAVRAATKELAQNPALCRSLLDASRASDSSSGAVDDEEADLLRFRSLYAAIVRARELREHGSKADQAEFQALWRAEQGTLPLGGP